MIHAVPHNETEVREYKVQTLRDTSSFDPSLMTHLLLNRPDVEVCDISEMLSELYETAS